MSDEEELPAYQPGPGFEHNSREKLCDISSACSSSTEIFLFQWALNDLPNIHGMQVPITLESNGCSGSFEDLSGKKYDIVGTNQEQGPSVFMPSASEIEIDAFSNSWEHISPSFPRALPRSERARAERSSEEGEAAAPYDS
ncbi:hypothetical protein LINGRAHAP2_LOCUS36543 [Linum grandiflorum]